MPTSASMSESRDELLQRFLAAAGWGAAERHVLAADASFRRYDRLWLGDRQAVLMDAPPPKEDVRPFIAVARLLEELRLSAPRLLAEDRAQGFLLLEDLGDRTFTRALAGGADELALYTLATDTLVALHRRWQPAMAGGIKPYDAGALLTEALLLTDWYLPAVSGQPTEPKARAAYEAAWRAALAPVAEKRETLVLRDYHVDNLMELPGRGGVAACGLLDFQDALIGARAYDLVSLLEDARRDVSPAVSEAMLARYLAALPEMDREELRRDYYLLGAQRSAKIIGIFTRLDRRDGKSRYLGHIPRLWRLVEGDLRHPALAPVAAWFAEHVPPSLRRVPAAAPGEGVPQ